MTMFIQFAYPSVVYFDQPSGAVPPNTGCKIIKIPRKILPSNKVPNTKNQPHTQTHTAH